ncbi:MAG: hypothetical protein K8S18_02180 [Desulfobacula sp.]|nr:hypothetical protein [Desulfobacula sp.]MCK5162140.1 hypothetical protein [Desulfobacula sp.]
MNLVLFIHQDASKKGETLKNVIGEKFYGTKLTILHTFNAFKARLKLFSNYSDKEIFILFADSKNRLNELTSLIDLLEGKRLIIILPDESKATLSRASQFFPRFFTPVSETYNDLCDVLNKMMNQDKIKLRNYNKGGNLQ